MTNILFLYERDMPTVSSMRMGINRLFDGKDIDFSFKSVKIIEEQDVLWLDTLVLIRADNTFSRDIAMKVKKKGKKVIFFMDDDLFNLPENMPSMPWRQHALRKNMLIADVMFSPSPYLCEKYKGYMHEGRYAQVDTAVSGYEIMNAPQKEEDSGRVNIVYAAGANHEELFQLYISPILPELSLKYGDKISLSFVGVHPQIDDSLLLFQIEYFASKPLEEYREFMRDKNFDIGLSPLHDDEFSKCKYFNKYIEYTIVGVVGIYSNSKPYTYVVKDGVNGFLTENHSGDWYKKICEAIDYELKRKKCYENALIQLREDFNDQAIQDKLFEQIPEFEYTYRKADEKYSLWGCRLKYRFSRICDWIYLTVFYLSKTGVKGFVDRLKFHIKESDIYS